MCSTSTMFMDAPNLAHRLKLIRSSTQRVDEPIKTIIIIIGESKNRSKEAERRKNCKGSSDLEGFHSFFCAFVKKKKNLVSFKNTRFLVLLIFGVKSCSENRIFAHQWTS